MSEQHDTHRGVEWTAKRRRRALVVIVAVLALIGMAAPKISRSVSWSEPKNSAPKISRSVSWSDPKDPSSISWS
jgi:uncharacterized membrane protein YcfT